MQEVRRLRQERGWTQTQLAFHSGLAPSVISQIENDKRDPSAGTLRKLARALEVEVGDLFPKGQAPLPDFEDERRSAGEAAVEDARRLKETGWAQMWKALSEWRASKKRGESYAARRKYLDEMGSLLQEVYDADMALGEAYIKAALTQGGSKAPWPSYLQSESRKMGHFYGALLGLVTSAGLSIRAGTGEADSKDVPLERRPGAVEEPAA